MNVLCENIGYDGNGNWKYSCPSCHNIILTKEKKESISCPECQFVVTSDLTYGELEEEFDFESLNPWHGGKQKRDCTMIAIGMVIGIVISILAHYTL